jgi:hypothetical protein
MSRIRTTLVLASVWACALTGTLIFTVAPAFGGVGHEYRSQISGFARPWGLTFDTAGSLFAPNLEAAEGEVRVFNSKNEEQLPIGRGTLVDGRSLTTTYARNVAVDDATGDVYVADSGPDGVYVFKPIGGGLYENIALWTGTNAGGFGGGYVSVAVDNDAQSASDPHGGDVYVESSSNNAVDILRPKPTGPEEDEEGTAEGELEPPAEGFAFEGNVGMAVGPHGTVYVPNSAGSRLVYEFDGTGALIGSLSGSETPAGGFGEPIATAVNQATEELFVVDRGNDVIDQFSATGKYLAKIKSPVEEPLGVAVQSAAGPTQGDVYVSDGVAKVVDIFGPNVVKPEPAVRTGTAKEEMPTAATLTGGVNPEGSASTYWFEYGPTVSYGSTTPREPAGEGSAERAVETRVESLEPDKTYHYRLVAENEFGAGTGDDGTVTTASERPSVEGEVAGSIKVATATLQAEVNPENEATRYYFEYGTSPTLAGAATAPTPAAELPAGEDGNEAATGDLTGLLGNTAYYYRAVAENGTGRSEGPIESFTTEPGPPLVTSGSVSNVSSLAASVVGTTDPEAHETTYYYQYGTSTSYGQATPTSSAGAGNTSVATFATLSDLAPATLYHYRLVATNDNGTSHGEDETFTTLGGGAPIAATGSASDVTANAATVSGSIETAGLPTNYAFEVGTEGGHYGPPTGVAFVGPGFGDVPAALALENLEPGTTYHYRVVASNQYGTSAGADQSFTTAGIETPLSQPPTVLLLATPPIAFPGEPIASTIVTPPKPETRAQRLARALKVCAKQKSRERRAACERQAEKRYGKARH